MNMDTTPNQQGRNMLRKILRALERLFGNELGKEQLISSKITRVVTSVTLKKFRKLAHDNEISDRLFESVIGQLEEDDVLLSPAIAPIIEIVDAPESEDERYFYIYFPIDFKERLDKYEATLNSQSQDESDGFQSTSPKRGAMPIQKTIKPVEIKKSPAKFKEGDQIKTLEILKGTGRIKVYVNGSYSQELGFSRGKNWGKMYELAENGSIDFDKAFLDYFNSNQKNPLYTKPQLAITKILKSEDKTIVPNIKIKLQTQKYITQQRNSA